MKYFFFEREIWYDGKMSKTKMRGEDEHVRLRVKEICTSIHSHFQHFPIHSESLK
jgi:hypothetical protein